jgi:hypothetical protein
MSIFKELTSTDTIKRHEWQYDRITGKNAKGETPEHHENVFVYLKDGRKLEAYYDIYGCFKPMQGVGIIWNVTHWERIGEFNES